MSELQDFLKYAEAVNADRYRVTCIKMEADGGKKTFILDKKGGMTRGFSSDELASYLPEMLRIQNRGENIYYTPLSDNRHHILIDDMNRESLERLKQNGYAPAIILESSPENYQCILTVPKLGTELDREIANKLTMLLNKQYGDKKLCGCIHPHRAPGFQNRKPKHQRQDGTFPRVKLLTAERRECPKAFALTQKIYTEFMATTNERKQCMPIISEKKPRSAQAAYYAHLDNIRRHINCEDFSRVDAMIALRMRANGHSRKDIMETIEACAPTIRDGQANGRNWQKYAERTVDYAFGPAGDRDLMRNEGYQELWHRIESSNDTSLKYTRKRMR